MKMQVIKFSLGAILLSLILFVNPQISFTQGAATQLFIRGNSNGDGKIDIADVVSILNYLFKGDALSCGDAADVDDNGKIEVTDAIALGSYLFLNGGPPALPFPNPGLDWTTSDAYTCGDVPAYLLEWLLAAQAQNDYYRTNHPLYSTLSVEHVLGTKAMINAMEIIKRLPPQMLSSLINPSAPLAQNFSDAITALKKPKVGSASWAPVLIERFRNLALIIPQGTTMEQILNTAIAYPPGKTKTAIVAVLTKAIIESKLADSSLLTEEYIRVIREKFLNVGIIFRTMSNDKFLTLRNGVSDSSLRNALGILYSESNKSPVGWANIVNALRSISANGLTDSREMKDAGLNDTTLQDGLSAALPEVDNGAWADDPAEDPLVKDLELNIKALEEAKTLQKLNSLPPGLHEWATGPKPTCDECCNSPSTTTPPPTSTPPTTTPPTTTPPTSTPPTSTPPTSTPPTTYSPPTSSSISICNFIFLPGLGKSATGKGDVFIPENISFLDALEKNVTDNTANPCCWKKLYIYVPNHAWSVEENAKALANELNDKNDQDESDIDCLAGIRTKIISYCASSVLAACVPKHMNVGGAEKKLELVFLNGPWQGARQEHLGIDFAKELAGAVGLVTSKYTASIGAQDYDPGNLPSNVCRVTFFGIQNDENGMTNGANPDFKPGGKFNGDGWSKKATSPEPVLLPSSPEGTRSHNNVPNQALSSYPETIKECACCLNHEFPTPSGATECNVCCSACSL